MTRLIKDVRTTYIPAVAARAADPGRPAVPAHVVTTYVPDNPTHPPGTNIIGYRQMYVPPDPVSGADGYYALFPIWG